MPTDHDAYAALRHRDYRCLLGGATLSSIGLGVQTVAIGWEVYDRTGSMLMLGLTGLAQFLPVLLLALPAGQAADHYNRKHVLQLAQAVGITASLGLTALSLLRGPVEVVLACLVLSGTGRALGAPSRIALLPQVVPLEDVPNAVAWNSTGWQFASVTGPALGGFVVALAPPAAAYLITAGCALACVALLIPVRPIPRSLALAPPRTLEALVAGVGFVWRSKLLLAAITLDLFAVLLGGATALLPVFARDILRVGPAGLGWLRAAPALGALVMGLLLAHLPPLRRPGLALLGCVAGFGLTMIAFGLSQSFFLSFSLLALSGALDNVSVVVRGTLVQVLTPDEMRGRVAAVNTVFVSSSNELGEFESGVTAEWFGPIPSVVGGGAGTILVVLLVACAFPALVRLGPLHALPRPTPESAPSGDERFTARPDRVSLPPLDERFTE
jgi:MFS family permease